MKEDLKSFVYGGVIGLIILTGVLLTSALPSDSGGSIDFSYSEETNMSEQNVSIAEYLDTDDGGLIDDVSDILGSLINNDLGWITNAVSDLVNYYTKTEIDNSFYNKSEDINATGYDVIADSFIGDGSQLSGIAVQNNISNGYDGDCFYVGNLTTTYTMYCPTYLLLKVN